MFRLRALQFVMVLVGLGFLACLYPLVTSLLTGVGTDVSRGDQMILGIYFPIGVFMLMAVRNPSAHRSLIACVGWSNLGHVTVMIIQGLQHGDLRGDLPGFSAIAVISAALILLLPAKQAADRARTAGAL